MVGRCAQLADGASENCRSNNIENSRAKSPSRGVCGASQQALERLRQGSFSVPHFPFSLLTDINARQNASLTAKYKCLCWANSAVIKLGAVNGFSGSSTGDWGAAMEGPTGLLELQHASAFVLIVSANSHVRQCAQRTAVHIPTAWAHGHREQRSVWNTRGRAVHAKRTRLLWETWRHFHSALQSGLIIPLRFTH